jgi:histidyl-tRNA synthetase
MASFIEPKILKGFRDFLPQAEIVRRNLTGKIESSFRSFGFVPIDTPALEYSELLLGKGGGETEKQIYRFTDNGGRDVALRFDLTVPFARFTAMHREELVFPLKRYHIAKVWRGENTQRGRYREFTQCDFDIIGSDSPAADFEILLLIRSTLLSLGLEASIRVNHRGLFNRFISGIGAGEKTVDILRAVDKLGKAGLEETENTLVQLTGEKNTRKILDFISAGGGKAGSDVGSRNNAGSRVAGEAANYEQTLERITELSGGPCDESERLGLLRRFMHDTGTSGSFILDPSITRGLDYYTGLVFETFLSDLGDIGSICSGGRYDNLCGLYSKTPVSGVGSSIGLDRMIAAMESLDRLPPAAGYAAVAVACTGQEQTGLNQVLAAKFRELDIPCEVFLESSALVKQYVTAEKKGIRWLIIPGKNPLSDPLTLRDIAKRQNIKDISIPGIIDLLKSQNSTK